MVVETLNLVTHCDSNYLSRAYVLRESIMIKSSDCQLYIVCYDKETFENALKLDIPKNSLILLENFYRHFPELMQIKNARSHSEFMFCLTPYILIYMTEILALSKVLYIDADQYITGNPKSLFELDLDPIVAISSHNFLPELTHLNKYGKYNVGVLLIKRTPESLALMKWWARKCRESTSVDEKNPEVFGDQKYLDSFSLIFPDTYVYKNLGINCAPWNCEKIEINAEGAFTMNDTLQMETFHFSGLKYNKFFFMAGFSRYRKKLPKNVKKLLYDIYVPKLIRADKVLQKEMKIKLTVRQIIYGVRFQDIGKIR